jgi:pimeloyl-ACP methyl ester carboxylesterase
VTTIPQTTTDIVTRYLDRPDGRIAYEVVGNGPLVVCAPGMGDVRAVYRFVVPALAAAGFRVATMDLRGHGDSDTSFSSYDDVAVGEDLLALVAELGGPAVLIGNSMSAGGAAWAAAEDPAAVAGLVLIGPFVRQVPINPALILAMRVALTRPWGRAVWSAYYSSLYKSRRPDDLAEHRTRIRASLARPGGWKAFLATTRTDHAPVEARLPEVTAPTLVVMGSDDPDFPDPRAEAELVAERLGGETLMIEGAGHYPQAESPEVVGPAIGAFLQRAHGRA